MAGGTPEPIYGVGDTAIIAGQTYEIVRVLEKAEDTYLEQNVYLVRLADGSQSIPFRITGDFLTPDQPTVDGITGFSIPDTIVAQRWSDNGTWRNTGYTYPLPIQFPFGLLDMFGRMNVSLPTILFECQFTYDDFQDLKWEHVTVSGGTVAHDATNRGVTLTLGSSTTSAALMQTRKVMPYQPGKSQKIEITATLGDGVADIVKRIGYFDDNNGMFFELNGTTLNAVVRKNGSDTKTALADWSVDVLDGDGVSGVELDLAMAQIWTIRFQALYVGTVEFGITVNGKFWPCHRSHTANVAATTYIQTANLPCRAQISKSAVATTESFDVFCVAVHSEGGASDQLGQPFTANRSSLVSVNSGGRPVLSIRPRALFNSIVNYAQIIPETIEIFTEDKPAQIVLIWGGTLTGASWANVDGASVVEWDESATAIANGIEVKTYYIEKAGRGTYGIKDELMTFLTEAGSHPTVASNSYTDALTIFMSSTNVATDSLAAFNWKEIR